MDFLKMLACVIVGSLIANYLWFRLLPQYNVQLSSTNLSPTMLSPSLPTLVKGTQSYANFDQKRLFNVTFKNESLTVLSCGKYLKNNYDQFMVLSGGSERTYDAIEEGQSIGCSLRINSGSSTVLNWFNLLTSGVYRFSLERVPCPSCKGVTSTHATVVTDPAGKRIIPQM